MEIPYDPDFDTAQDSATNTSSAFEAIGSKWSFVVGFAFAVLGIGTFGFLYLLLY